MVFQDEKLLYDRDVFSNVSLPLKICGEPNKLITDKVNNILSKVSLLDKARAMPLNLSGGERQRGSGSHSPGGAPSLGAQQWRSAPDAQRGWRRISPIVAPAADAAAGSGVSGPQAAGGEVVPGAAPEAAGGG